MIAFIKEKLPYVSWVGFYRAKGSDLWVGPYQGKLACLKIPEGKGVCRKAFKENRVLTVKNVEEFEGHIACDALSRSEIVLPVGRLGVLDLDSHELAAFDQEDEKGLKVLLSILESAS